MSFETEDYPVKVVVDVAFREGGRLRDCIKGVDAEHAMARARWNWKGAKVAFVREGDLSEEEHLAYTDARFVPMQVEGEWTVWDAESQRYLVHEARWDARAAYDVAERLFDRPYVGIWTWSNRVEVG